VDGRRIGVWTIAGFDDCFTCRDANEPVDRKSRCAVGEVFACVQSGTSLIPRRFELAKISEHQSARFRTQSEGMTNGD
jgi:hypothetical protein